MAVDDEKEKRRKKLEAWKAEQKLAASAGPASTPAPAPAASAEDEKEKRRKKLEAWKAQQAATAAAAPAPAAPAPSAAATQNVFGGHDESAEAAQAEAEKAMRRSKLLAMAADMEREKYIESVAPGMNLAQSAVGATDEEEDPLDAFMKSNAQKAVKEKEKADAHQRAWDAQYADKDVEICEKIEEEKNMNLHCYVCKMWGHTKVNCPHKKCRFCGKEGHVKENCPMMDEKVSKQLEEEKAHKRQKGYAAKKAKRKEQWEAELRKKTGVDGFAVLYEILELPPRKLATKEQIKRAYHKQSLRYHPDKVLPEEAEEAAEKFVAVKAAYELLLEGMETGGEGMGGAVFSGGDLGYSGMDMGAVAATAAAAAGFPTGAASSSEAGPSSLPAVEEPPTGAGAGAGEARGGGAAPEAGADAAVPDAAAEEEGGGLTEEQLGLLLQDENVQRAMAEIAADPEAIVRYQDDPVVMGVIHALNAQ